MCFTLSSLSVRVATWSNLKYTTYIIVVHTFQEGLELTGEVSLMTINDKQLEICLDINFKSGGFGREGVDQGFLLCVITNLSPPSFPIISPSQSITVIKCPNNLFFYFLRKKGVFSNVLSRKCQTNFIFISCHF